MSSLKIWKGDPSQKVFKKSTLDQKDLEKWTFSKKSLNPHLLLNSPWKKGALRTLEKISFSKILK